MLESEISLAEGKIDEALAKAAAAVEEGEKKGSVSASVLIHQAGIHAARGNSRKANEIISRIDRRKLDAPGYLALSRYFRISREEEKIVPLLKEGTATFPGNPELLYYYALELFRLGNYEEATKIFKKVYSAMPNSRVAAYRLGQSLIAAGRLDEANEIISHILTKHPSDVLGLSLKVRYQLRMGDNRGAIESLKTTISLVPEAPRPYTLIGEIYWHEGILSLAEKYATIALNQGEKGLSPHFVLGDIYMKQGRFNLAADHYKRILEREPLNIVALSQIADAYANMGNVRPAMNYLDKILLHYPHVQWVKRKKELLLASPKGPAALLETAQKHVEQNPSDPQAKIALVQALILNNQLAEAVAVLRNALKKEPRNQWYLLTLGDLLLVRGELVEATEVLERAVKLNPQDVNLLINVGGRLEKINLDNRAEEKYLMAYKQEKENPLVINQLAWFYVDKVKNFEKAKPFIEILRLKGEGAFEKDTVGWYYCQTGDYRAAEGFLREAVQLDPANHVIRAHWALSLYKVGKVNQGEKEKNKILSMIPAGGLREELIRVAGEMRK